MGKHSAGDKKNLIITIIIIVVVVAIAAGLFLFFTLYDWSGANRSDQLSSQTSPSSDSAGTMPSGQEEHSTASSEFKQLDDPLLVLVNAAHKMPDGTDGNLVELNGVTLDKRAMAAYQKMYAAAAKDHITLWVSSSYRDPAFQGKLYQQEIDDFLKKGMTENEAVKQADRAVQKPGYSEHNTGLAMDFNGAADSFKSTKPYAWLMQNAANYGYILRYPAEKETITGIMYEPWHFRYVGVENAKKMKELHMCLEEYVEYVRSQ